MNKILILVIMTFSFSTGFGQGKTSFERIKALKMAYISEKILKIHHAEYHFNREMVYKRKKPTVQEKKD